MGRIFDISVKQGIAISTLFGDTEPAALPHQGWQIETHSAAGIDYALLTATESAVEFPLHADDNAWFGYVVAGAGELLLGDQNSLTESVTYQTGDVIVFQPGTFHGWKVASSETKLLFAKPT
ncbi:hypothetical protein GCM10011369_30880 [Neiella marina]|uniref:Cupin type-2 domain-containing protein n=1 Tax=Neiella marina TaxID=508461 RepID=A0A8J2U8Z1_9GAMM|nr:cupin domain-containing protein [Neiella marina]GGA86626.1 hypothetical protein GCM10011369_30880 [Neiella marina]